MKIILLLLTLLAHCAVYGQFVPTAERGAQPYLFQSFGPLNYASWPHSIKGKSFQIQVKNIWALSNVNALELNFQKVSSHWSSGARLGAFIHPGCQDYQLHWRASTKIGAFTSLGLQLGAGYTTWLNQTNYWRPMATLHYAMYKKQFFFECNTHFSSALYSEDLNRISPVWQSVLSILITPEIMVQGNTILADNGLRNAQFNIGWKCNKSCLVSIGMGYPAWGWSLSMAWILPQCQQGWGYQQSAWVRPSMDYWIRFSEQ